MKDHPLTAVNLKRHMSQCSICRSPYRQEIEEKWTNWCCTHHLAKDYSISRDCVYRHMHALGLFRKRQRNIARALEQIIERVDRTPMGGAQIIAAIKAYVQLAAEKQPADPAEGIDFNELFGRMSEEEREGFFQHGTLADWFSKTIDATRSDGQGGEKGSPGPETPTVQ